MYTSDREQVLHSLKSGKTFDLLVIGGGATGCGIALDAASRGLHVALVEQGDFAEGTSGRSTKLLHGGVRYLESAVKHLDPAQYRLVRDGLRERGILLRIAPHLCKRISLVTPLYRWIDVPYVSAGLKLYDILAGSLSIGRSSLLSSTRALERFPMLKSAGLKAGVSYYDGQFNDARFAVALACTAAGYGAKIANHVKVQKLLKVKDRVAGAGLTDTLTDTGWEIFARVVINATGPQTDILREMDCSGIKPILNVSSGTHLVLGSQFSPPDTGLLIPRTEDGRVLFILPWEEQTLVGTTDEPSRVSERPIPTTEEIDYLVHHICKYFDLRFSKDDIKAIWSGLRPLVIDPRKADTAGLSRDHVLEESPSGLLTITGGKWTTYRKMASDTVDYAVRKFGLVQKNRCVTEHLYLIGGKDYVSLGGEGRKETLHENPSVARHLDRAYGDQAEAVCKMAEGKLNKILVKDYPFLEAEVVWAVREEMACRAMDVLARRTPLALLDTTAAGAATDRVIEIMASELGWDPDRERMEKQEVGERLSTGI